MKRKRGYGMRLLLACCFLFAWPLGALASEGNVVKVNSFDQFTDAVIDMIDKNGPAEQSAAGAEDIFCNKRLIVKVKSGGLDMRKYGAVSVIDAGSLYVLQFATCEETERAMRQLRASGGVEYVEPDANMKGAAAGTGATRHYSWGVSRIGADKLAAELAPIRRQELTVAVVDTGVASHPVLDGRVTAGYDFVDNDETPIDLNRHGTHVAGTVVDCTPGLNVKIMPVRVLDERGRGLTLTVALGVRYAVDHGASVINLSLSGRHSSFLDENISYAIGNGVTVVVAAGNEAGDTAQFCPSHINEAIVVGAVDSGLNVAYFSNKGSSLDLVAPGVNVNGPVLGNGFDSLSGTSMAAPHVAAIAAMYKLQDPSRTPAQIDALLKSNAKDLGPAGWDSSYGFGLVEAYKTVEPAKVSLNKSALSLAVGKSARLKATVTPEGASKKLSWKSSNKKVATVTNGKVTAKKAGKATITVTNGDGKKAACKVTVTAKAQKKKQPTKVSLNKKKLSLVVGTGATLKATVSPADAVKKLSWKSSNTKVATVKNGKVTAKKTGKATITVRTGNGKKAVCQVTVTKKSQNQGTQSLKARRKQVLAQYRKMLQNNKKYKYFSLCYINEDSIPDLMVITKKNSSNYAYYINGKKAADQTMGMMVADDPGVKLTYYYYPKKNLVMYRYKEAIPEVYYWEDYCTFAPCRQKGYEYALMEVLTKSWEAPDGTPEYGYYYFSDASVPESQYDELLGDWVVGRDSSWREFKKVLAEMTGKTKRQKIKFVGNTACNRTKYLSK